MTSQAGKEMQKKVWDEILSALSEVDPLVMGLAGKA